jgi:S-adenosylmethionine synthetase
MSMYPKNMFFTSESVTEGHPDKVCDQVSDAVLDECLRLDPMSRVACNTLVTMGMTCDGKFMTEEAKQQVIDAVARPVLGDLIDAKTKFTVNGTGKFLVGGPQADTGLTGRKIIVDTYGGWADHGGGAFSGKDPTKVDRSAGYMARYIAKNIVAAGLADECLLQLGYCIGLVDPVSVMVNTYGTGTIPDESLSALVRDVFPLSPGGIIDHLRLREPIYLKTAAYGHFGREEFAWERVDAIEELLTGAKRP